MVLKTFEILTLKSLTEPVSNSKLGTHYRNYQQTGQKIKIIEGELPVLAIQQQAPKENINYLAVVKKVNTQRLSLGHK